MCLLAVRDPNILHLRRMVQEPAAFALLAAEPVNFTALITEYLLQVPTRQGLSCRTTGFTGERPDRIHIVMFRQHLHQLSATPRNHVYNRVRSVAGLKNLVQVADDEGIRF